jgi:hypothetical protein
VSPDFSPSTGGSTRTQSSTTWCAISTTRRAFAPVSRRRGATRGRSARPSPSTSGSPSTRPGWRCARSGRTTSRPTGCSPYAFYFTRLGIYLERADNTARILDVKYHVLLPRQEPVGGALDHAQWQAILRAVSALRSYHWVYRDRLLILRPEMPRSLLACFTQVTRQLDLLADCYGGRRGECHRRAGELHARLRFGRIDAIFQSGLHDFLSEFVDQTEQLGRDVSAFSLA